MTKDFEKIEDHDHLCLIYHSERERFAAILPYVQIGLHQGEQCFYIADDETSSSVVSAMCEYGIDVDPAVKSGQLTFIHAKKSYLETGSFDPDRMIQFLQKAIDLSKAAGFSSFRITGDMTWILERKSGIMPIMDYEAKLNRLFSENNATAICQYNKELFPAAMIRDVIQTHPKVIIGSRVYKNVFFIPPNEFLEKEKAEVEVQRLLDRIVSRQLQETGLQESKGELEVINKQLNDEITALKQVQKALLEMTADLKRKKIEAEELSRIKTEFVSNVSHELRTPLNAILGYSYLLLDGAYGEIGESQKDPVEGVRRNADILIALVNDVLDLSKIESGKKYINLDIVDVNFLINDLVTAMAPILSQKTLKVRLELNENLPTIESDGNKIKQILTNLLSNAVKFTQIGEIIIRTKGLNRDAIEVSIEDTGMGIRPEELPRIFEAYHQVDGTTYGASLGVGLGLAIVKELTHLLKAEIKVQSNFGKGSVFTVTFPYRFDD
jgi:signal transduction histidine kinase